MYISKPISLWAFLCLPFIISAIDESSFREKKCSEIESLGDMQWMSTVKAWYIPLWSKLDRSRTASDILGKAVSDVRQSDLGSASCILIKNTKWVYGFNSKVKYDVAGDATGSTFKALWKGGKSIQFKYHLTDNRSYILGISCYEDGQATWSVMSTEPKLSSDEKGRIIDYVTALGFKEENIFIENYDKCNIHEIKDVKDEL